jgi:hypothetical protein
MDDWVQTADLDLSTVEPEVIEVGCGGGPPPGCGVGWAALSLTGRAAQERRALMHTHTHTGGRDAHPRLLHSPGAHRHCFLPRTNAAPFPSTYPLTFPAPPRAPSCQLGPDGKPKKKSRVEEHSSDEEHGDFDPQQLREHEEFTKVKNIDVIQLGPHEMHTWYFSPFPPEYNGCKKLFFCEYRWAGVGWAGLGWSGLGWGGLGWAGLGWVGLGWGGGACGKGGQWPGGAQGPGLGWAQEGSSWRTTPAQGPCT